MTRRQLLLGLGLLAFIGLVGSVFTGFWWAYDYNSTRPGVTEANFNRILPGMTKADVEALMGCEPFMTCWESAIANTLDDQSGSHMWVSPSCYIWVWFDTDGGVKKKDYQRHSPESWADKVRRWVGL